MKTEFALFVAKWFY